MGMKLKAFTFWMAAALAPLAAASAAPAPPTPLFASDEPIHIVIKGPISAIERTMRTSKERRDGTITLATAAAETLPVRLSPRGITRLKPDVCQFPPLRVEFVVPPPKGSLFEGQKQLKLVTHCRQSQAFEKHLLLEYAVYRLYNVLSPLSHRVRLATVDYVNDDGKPLVSRIGFFIDHNRELAARNGMQEVRVRGPIPTTRLSAREAARAALLNYMIGNLDWSLRNGPANDDCCHNADLIAPSATGGIVPVSYDFDFSGLVGAPYAVPPDIVPVRSVRQRYYRGYCLHNDALLAEAAAFRSKRTELIDTMNLIPSLDPKARAGAISYLEGFFRDIATDDGVRSRLLRTCIN